MNRDYNEEFDNRLFRVILGVIGIVSVVLSIILIVAAAIGLFALINYVLC